MKTRLLISDLHLTDRAKDEYRWALFPWLKEQIKKHKVERLYCLGDLTDFKDKHSSILTNRIVNVFSELGELCEVVILKGNHDFIQQEKPFFEFLKKIQGVTYVNAPYEHCDNEDCNEIFLPHSKTPTVDWKDIDFDQYDFAYMHQCVIGSVGANEFEMEHGLNASFFKGKKCKVISGDIHVPQVVGTSRGGMVEYVGTPYPVAFGDHYKGRCVLIRDGEFIDLHFPTIQKMSIKIKSPDALKVQRVKTGDQVSVKMVLAPSDFCNWPNYKKKVQEWAESKGILLHNVSLETDGKRKFEEADEEEVSSRSFLSDPKEILRLYADREKIDKSVLDAGLKLL